MSTNQIKLADKKFRIEYIPEKRKWAIIGEQTNTIYDTYRDKGEAEHYLFCFNLNDRT